MTSFFLLVFGVVSGEDSNSLLSSQSSFSGESSWILAKRFFRAAAIMPAVSLGIGDLALDLTGVPPGDLKIKLIKKNSLYKQVH